MAEGQNDKLRVRIANCLEVSASGRFAISVVAAFGLLFGIGRVTGWW
jgi:hypothetical protein